MKNTEYNLSLEGLFKISKKMKKKWKQAEYREMMIKKLKERWADPEWKRKNIEKIMLGRKKSNLPIPIFQKPIKRVQISRKFNKNIKLHLKWKKKIFTRDNFECRGCGCNFSTDFHCHHINERSIFPELQFDPENGVTLCGDCHRHIHRMQRISKNNEIEPKEGQLGAMLLK